MCTKIKNMNPFSVETALLSLFWVKQMAHTANDAWIGLPQCDANGSVKLALYGGKEADVSRNFLDKYQ